MNTHAMNFFDTLEYAKHLMKGGFSQIQAETLAQENKEIFNSNLASKKDLAETKAEIIKWVVGLMFAQSALIISAIKFLP